MKTTEILEILQLLHAGDQIDALARFESRGLLEEISNLARMEDRMAAAARIGQFGLTGPIEVFQFHSRVFGHALWHCDREENGIIATARTCKLCAIARARGTARPCALCCTDPLAALCAALPSPVSLSVVSTLWNEDRCRIHLVPIHPHIAQDQQ
jgi:hypothetical protein